MSEIDVAPALMLPSPEQGAQYSQPEVVESASKSLEIRRIRQIEALAATRLIMQRADLSELKVTSVKEASEVERIPGIYIFDDNISSISEVKFTPSEDLLSGAADSAHAVILGDLVVTSSKKKESPLTTVAAAKCSLKRDHESRVSRALTEITLNQELGKWGFMAFEPILLAIGGGPSNGAVVLMTKYDKSLTSLDNLPWGRGAHQANLKSYANKAAASLAEFHTGFSCMHGDAKIKNFVAGPSGKVNPIDFETSTPFNNTNPMEVGSAIHQDLALLFSSLEHRGFLNQSGYEAHREAAESMVEAYINSWADKGFSADVQDAVMNMAMQVAQPYANPEHER